jgi:hypothetical protein
LPERDDTFVDRARSRALRRFRLDLNGDSAN